MKTYDVVGICNALMDILIAVDDDTIKELELTKGNMHLVDADRQKMILERFNGTEQTVELGGSAMNAIRTLAGLGGKTAFAGMVAEDEFGDQITKRMADLGIVEKLGVSTTEPTGTCLILVTPDGERTMNTNLGASRLYTTSDVPTEEIKQAKVLHFCGYQWDTDGQKQAIKEAVKIAKEAGTKISFDVADPFVVGRFQDEFKELISEGADIVFSNREEAKLLYNSSPEEAAEKIAATGAIAVVKLGADGAIVQTPKEGLIKIDPVATKVVDTTAAGDMFAAGFLYGFVNERSLEACGHLAAFMASDVISRMGATISDEAMEKAKTVR